MGAVSSRRLGVGVVGSLLVLIVWAGVAGWIPGPEAPAVPGSTVPAVERSSGKASLADCSYSIVQTGDFAEPGCAGWAEDDPRLAPAFQVLEILQADECHEFQR